MSARARPPRRGFLPLSHWQILAVFAGMLGGAVLAHEFLVPDLVAAALADGRDVASLVERASTWTGGLAIAGGIAVAVACDAVNRFNDARRARRGAAGREIRFLTSLGSRHGTGDADPSSLNDEPR